MVVFAGGGFLLVCVCDLVLISYFGFCIVWVLGLVLDFAVGLWLLCNGVCDGI